MRVSQSRQPDSTTGAGAQEPSSVKETVISVIIAFALAFVFRGFVIEAFLIPTGSMAPTLMGAHEQFKSPRSGYQWAVTPWNYNGQDPTPVQGPMTVHDPMTGAEFRDVKVDRSWGDRIFVMKYLYSIYDPQRFDVVVFKNPRDPTVNYIKRLTGLPGEMIAIIDGDIFSRKWAPGEENAENPWLLPGWSVNRKPDRAQRAMWQPVFSSEYTPIRATIDNLRWFDSPWRGGGPGWQIEVRRDYEYSGSAPTVLEWD